MEHVDRKKLNVFGYGLALIISVLTVRHAFHHGGHIGHIIWLAGAVYVTAITIRRSPQLEAFYHRWMAVAHRIGTVLTWMILTTLYLTVFTPAALVLKILRKDILDQKWNPGQVTSYWKPVAKDADPQQYLKQY